MKISLFSLVACLLVIGNLQGNELKQNTSFSTQEDLKAIVNQSFLLQEKFFPQLLSMYAMQILETSDKTLDQKELLNKVQQAMQSPAIVQKLSEPYERLFTPDEIHYIRKLYEDKAFQKLNQSSLEIAKANHQTLKDVIAELIETYGQEKDAKIAYAQTSGGSHAIEVSQDNFEQEIKQSKKPIVIDFYADWCSPCKAMMPVLESLSKSYGDKVKFTKVNSDRSRHIASEYHITQLPTFVLIKDGKVVGKYTGLMSQSEFEAKINQTLLSK